MRSIVILIMFLFTTGSGWCNGTNPGFQIGQEVEFNVGGNWERVIIAGPYRDTGFGYGAYLVRWKDKDYTQDANAHWLRPVTPPPQAATPPLDAPAAEKPATPAETAGAAPVLAQGTQVLYTVGGVYWNPAGVVSYDAEKRQYRVLPPSGSGDIVPAYAVHVPGRTPSNDFFIGSWQVHVRGSYHLFEQDRELRRQYASGMKLPPLEIKRDGTYVWRTQEGPVINGRWVPRDGVPGITLLQAVNGQDITLFESTESYAPGPNTRDEIGMIHLPSQSGHYQAVRIGPNRSVVLTGRTF